MPNKNIRIPKELMKWSYPDRATSLKGSAKFAINSILRWGDEAIDSDHRSDFIYIGLWKYTEATGDAAPKIKYLDRKYNVRYWSIDAIEEFRKKGNKSKFNHEHVYPMSKMRDELLENKGIDNIDAILNRAIGCTVTRSEHQNKLSPLDNRYDGWDRYDKAGIIIYDRLNDKIVTVEEIKQQNTND